MRACLVPLVLLALGSACLAGEIRTGAAMQVKANSIWFEEDAAEKLAAWQAKKRGSAKAFAAYQKRMLSEREAWQFINEQPVLILSYEPEKNRVKVEMTGEGRLKDSTWFVDPAAIVQ